MKKILTPICVLISSFSFAQINILNADMPRQNDTMRYSETTVGITAAEAAKSGIDTIWDFTNLKAETQDIEKFYAPSATPYVLQFGLVNPATYGIKDDALNALANLGSFSGIKIENVYGFYKNTALSSIMVGRGLSVSGIPLAINFNPKDTVYKFPLKFGDIDTTYFKGTATIPSLGSIIQQGRRINNVDGWGLIKTPYGEFNCIKIRTEITETDSIDVTSFKLPIPNNRTIYTWYAKNEHYPILEITQSTGIAGTSTIKYKDFYRAEAFVSAARFNASRTTGTVLDTVNLTSTSTGTPKSYEWIITPNTVSYVAGTSATSNLPRILFNTPGTYSIQLKVIYEGGQDDTIRTNYVNINEAQYVNFVADKTSASIDETIAFSDKSTGSPIAYRWTFAPNTVTYVLGTSTSKNPIVKFTTKGNYSVSLTSTYPTGSFAATKTDYINIQNVGVNNTTDLTKTINIYPNPAKNNLFIESNFDMSKSEIQIFDILGKKIAFEEIKPINNSKLELNITTLNNGIYFVKIFDNNNVNFFQKIIVE